MAVAQTQEDAREMEGRPQSMVAAAQVEGVR